MKRIVFFLFFPLLFAGCQAQNDKEPEKENSGIPDIIAQNNIKPKVDIRVNKKYDDKGNLIGYDSTYSWSYSTIQGDSANINADTVFSEFRPLFDKHFPEFSSPFKNEFFGVDSLFYNDFLSPDYFYDWWHRDLIEQEKTFRRMDSLKNEFFNQHYPGLTEP